MERSRGIYELAVSQPTLDMPEVLWKAYIDFEIDQEEFDNTRKLYRRLLSRTQHIKVVNVSHLSKHSHLNPYSFNLSSATDLYDIYSVNLLILKSF